MPVDARIPLTDTHPWNPMDAISMQQLAMQLKTQQMQYQEALRQQQVRGQLMDLYRDPANADPTTGMLKPVALSKITDPALRMQLAEKQTLAAERTATMKKDLSQATAADMQAQERQIDAVHDSAMNIRNYYQEQRSKGIPEQQAIENTQSFYTEETDRLKKSGHFSEEQLARMPAKFDPAIIEKAITGTETYRSRKQAQREETPFIKELKAEGILPGSPEFTKALAQRRESQGGGVIVDPDTRRMMAEQALAGDRSVFSGLGYGKVGAQNRAQLRSDVTLLAKQRGMSGADIAAMNAEYFGIASGERTLGTRTANIGMAVSEAQMMTPLALEASNKVDRTKFPTLNSILLAAERGTGDENVVRLSVATNSLINIYARAINPTGVPTISDKDHARELLASAWTKGQYSAGVDQLMKELAAAQKAPGLVRREFREAVTAKKPEAEKSAPAGKTVTRTGTQNGRKVIQYSDGSIEYAN